MPIEHYFWIEEFDEAGFPPWPCPVCGRHSLSIKPESLSLVETRASKDARTDDWDPEWVWDRFVCLLECQHKQCGEVSVVAGTTSYRMNDQYVRHLEPHFVEPAPEIFRIPKSCPEGIAAELSAAFSLFWSDPSAALNRVRTSLELLLDSEKVQKRAKTKKGTFHPLSLHQRIEKFLPKDASTRTKMLAVKWLGNVGSHQRSVTRQQLLEAFELLEHILEIVVEKRPQRLERMAREITKRKGKPPKPILLLS